MESNTLHKKRWIALTAWIVIFSIAVGTTYIKLQHESDVRKKQRYEQCIKVFDALTTILHISIPDSRLENLTPEQMRRVTLLFASADPQKNCS